MELQGTAENMFKVNAGHALGQVAAMRALEFCMEPTRKRGNADGRQYVHRHFGLSFRFTPS
jgi:hypothetical protein